MVRQVSERAMGNGVKLRDENWGSWEIKQILYTDETVLVAETREHLQPIMNELYRAGVSDTSRSVRG